MSRLALDIGTAVVTSTRKLEAETLYVGDEFRPQRPAPSRRREASKRARIFLIVLILHLVSALVLPGQAQVNTQPHDNKQDVQPFTYEAEEGNPRDKSGEKRRDYAVLEATFNDLASSKNPEYRHRLRTVGSGREIVVHDRTDGCWVGLVRETRNIDREDPRIIPTDIREDFKRRRSEPALSLADFKPANRNIVIMDLVNFFEEASDREFRGRYPTAWGYVFAYLPAYSKDGTSAVVALHGGPSPHGVNWIYMLTKRGKRWEVQWRHCELLE